MPANSIVILDLEGRDYPMKSSKLNILWTTADPITSELMVFMYGINAKRLNWWEEVTIIIWGATAKLVQENEKMQELIKEAKQERVHISACKACAKQLDAIETLESLDVEVIYWGEPLTQIIKNGENLITI
jgi:hypothetical protein